MFCQDKFHIVKQIHDIGLGIGWWGSHKQAWLTKDQELEFVQETELVVVAEQES